MAVQNAKTPPRNVFNVNVLLVPSCNKETTGRWHFGRTQDGH